MPGRAGGSAGRGWRATSPRGPAVREPPPHALMILPRFYDYNQVVESGGLAVLAGDPRHLSMVLRASPLPEMTRRGNSCVEEDDTSARVIGCGCRTLVASRSLKVFCYSLGRGLMTYDPLYKDCRDFFIC